MVMDVLSDGLSVSLYVSFFAFSLSPCISGLLQSCNYNGPGRSVHISSAAFTITSNNPKALQNWYLVAHAL